MRRRRGNGTPCQSSKAIKPECVVDVVFQEKKAVALLDVKFVKGDDVEIKTFPLDEISFKKEER